MPRDLLRSSSEFFRKATKPEWIELRVDALRVEFEPDLFKAYIHWLHLATVPRQSDGIDYLDYPYLAKLYVMGEELMDVKFKNAIVDTIVAISIKHTWCPIGEAVSIIYAGTSESSKARRLMVDYCVNNANSDSSWTNEFQNCPKDFLAEVMKEMVKSRVKPVDSQKGFPRLDDLRSYHE